jgi:hypothetical protein
MSEVSPSVDVYSLGQVLFNLLSGGRVFLRENVHDARHDASFPPGEQAKWLRVLLGQMVTVKEWRIEIMEDVGAELRRVSDWKLMASAGSLTQQALAELAALRRRVQQEARDDVGVDKDIADLNSIRSGVETGVTALIEDKFKEAADQVRQGGDFDAGLSSESLAKALRIGPVFRCNELDVRRRVESYRRYVVFKLKVSAALACLCCRSRSCERFVNLKVEWMFIFRLPYSS